MKEFLFYDLFEHLLFFFEAFYPYIAPPSLQYKYKARIFQTNCFSSEKNSSTISILRQINNNLINWAFQMDDPDQQIFNQSGMIIDDLNTDTNGMNTSGGVY